MHLHTKTRELSSLRCLCSGRHPRQDYGNIPVVVSSVWNEGWQKFSLSAFKLSITINTVQVFIKCQLARAQQGFKRKSDETRTQDLTSYKIQDITSSEKSSRESSPVNRYHHGLKLQNNFH